MTTTTADQGITLPTDPDTADNPVAFTNFVGGVENRLVRRYTNEADRTARTTVTENAVTALASEDRVDIGDTVNWVSLAKRAFFIYVARTTDTAAIVSNTTLASDSVMTTTLQSGATYHYEGELIYDSSTTADIKIATLWPTVTAGRFNAFGHDPTTTTSFKSASATASDSALSFGGLGVGTIAVIRFSGYLTTTASGTFAVRYAQNTSDATNTTIRASSYLRLARMA